ncbi:LuxR C-terminal-related transcriptional regulator, partial [Nocardia sp. NPDC049190]|uniref:helix-turn-helix transcriptional regulator n=1 Tax=Nocardia sp. NPDC049190 TaxID=3155650 RepID=UPI003404D133
AATATLAWFASYQGTLDAGQELIDLAADGMDKHDIDLTPVLLEALADLVYAEMTNDRFRAAGRHAERGLRVSRTTGHGYAFGRFAIGAASSKLFLGQLNDARSAVETAVEATVLLDNDELLATAEALRCWIETARGDLQTALAAGRAAVRAAERQPDALFAWMAHACYGEALIESGETERGRQEIVSLGGSEFADFPPGANPFWDQVLITAELSAGRIDAAETFARRIEETSHGRSREANAHYARARIHLAMGDYSAATKSAYKAVHCFEAVEMRVWAARSRLVAGRSLGLAGEPETAVRELELAHGILDDAGAGRLRDEAAKELRTLGRRVRRQPSAVPTHQSILTERERDIADRVARGHTNREIAAELFISPKTIEKHLARIFVKLGVSSRAGVAATLNRRNTTPL